MVTLEVNDQMFEPRKQEGRNNMMFRRSLFPNSVAILLAICILTGCSVIPQKTIYEDYPSAGAYCQQQFAEHAETISLTCHTSDYNQIIGSDFVWGKIQAESVVHTGHPDLGDHIAIGIMEYTISSTAAQKKDGTYYLTMNVNPVYSTSLEQEQELAKKSAEILDSLRVDGASDYDKTLAIYRYICDNVVYDYLHLDDESYLLQYSAYAAAVQGTAVCAGIADLFYYLANSAGLDARIVTNSTHAWNFVKVDGEYYYVDATWDLGKSETEYEFFMKGSADFEHHLGNVSFGPNGFSNLLTGSDLDYDFSDWAYGYDPFAF